MDKERQTLRIVVVGHVDHGKSTLIGRLLYDTKSLPEGAVARVKRIAKEKGKLFEYAYLLDALEEEQKQGITIDTTQIQFFTAKRDYIIIDAPGHKEFLKNMISGAASAEAALLIIDANEGIREQSKRHGYILSLLGIQKVYVIVNKMDLIQYSEIEFKKIQDEMNQFLSNLHVHPLKYIPVSAFYGENLTHFSGKMPWYQGKTVLEALDLLEKEEGSENKPLRLPIQDVYKFDQRRIIAGRIETGSLKVGDEIHISPGNKTTKVKSIEYWAPGGQKEVVSAGMSIGITVEDEFFNDRGEVISHVFNGPQTGDIFQANIFWLGKKALEKKRTYKLKLNTHEVECEIKEVQRVIDASTLETIENAQEVKPNDVAEITIRTKHPVSFDRFKDNQNTGRFVLVDGFEVSGGGIITNSAENSTLATRLGVSGVSGVSEESIEKLASLRELLKVLGSVVVAYSGGVDSAFLLKVATDVLGDNCIGVSASSETYPESELKAAIEVAKEIGANHLLIHTTELANEQFACNPVDRCYYCKSELFAKLNRMAEEKGFNYVLDGANADDVQDYRPGMRAGKEMGIRSPLQEVCLHKNEIRELSHYLNLRTWDKPSFACLSSRFPYGHRITAEKLYQVEKAENFLRELGLKDLRVRHHDHIARIEVPRKDFPLMTGNILDLIVEQLEGLGFVYVTLDLKGLRSGSMNEALSQLN
ncbi:hypothetical protein JCM15765_43890 [Paradesulfitobacterium aromaticivorans]